ncbi:MAG: branched-chain amino acid ABC transporter permease [Anaerolineaceae bacterium]|nr:MAG: branched-chain amino acid ABC transporter permease [Anaerolineaceae bacterium]
MDFLIEAILSVVRPIGITEPVLQFMLVNAILGISMYLLLRTGMFSLANAGFMAIGAYVSVLLTKELDFALGAALVVAVIVCALIALPIGLPVLRLRDIYLAIATIGFGEVVRIFFLNVDNMILSYLNTFQDAGLRRYELVGGGRGVRNVERLTETWHLIVFLIVIIFLLTRLQRSRFGRAMVAVRQDERVAANMGINVVYVKNMVFVLSAMLAGAAGVFNGHLTRIVTPEMFGFDRAVDILAYAVLGGTSVWAGPIVGGFVLTALPEVLRRFNEYRGVFNGLVLLLVIVYLPGGLINPQGWRKLWASARRRLTGQPAQPEAGGG